MIALAISRGCEIGVDVEHVAGHCPTLDIAEHHFSPGEAAALALLPADMRQERFFAYWTLKESYIKARGMGLSLPLDRFGFEFPGEETLRIQFAPDLADCPERWIFWQYRPAAGYLMALCAERCAGVTPRVSIQELDPLAEATLLPARPLRTSATR